MIRAGQKWWKRGGADKSLTCGDVVESSSGLVSLGCKAGTVPTPRQGAGNTRGGSSPGPFCLTIPHYRKGGRAIVPASSLSQVAVQVTRVMKIAGVAS